MNTIHILHDDKIEEVKLPHNTDTPPIPKKYSKTSGLQIVFYGDNNHVTYHHGTDFRNCEWTLGRDCTVSIGKTDGHIKNLNISAYKSFKSNFIFGDNLTCVGANLNCRDSSDIIIGNDCMLSYNITIWNSDAHAIYDCSSLELMNEGRDVVIGDHVWIGFGVNIFKGVQIANNNIIGGCSVCRSKFTKQYTIITGNPAVVIKEGVNWDRRTPERYEREMIKNEERRKI